MGLKPKKARITDQDLVDTLIDWYDRFKPEAGKVIQTKLSREKLQKWAKATANPDEFSYRGRILRRVEE